MEYFKEFFAAASIEYERHNAHVLETVPRNRLLVWNVKDGWEPLCRFLGKPVPEIPFPHNNKTFDDKWVKEFYLESDIMKEVGLEIQKNKRRVTWQVTGCKMNTYCQNGIGN